MSAAIPERRRWLGVALIVSLAVNAFLIGGTAANLIHVRWPFMGPEHGPPGRERGGPPQFKFELGWLRGRLPPEGIDKVGEAIRDARPEMSVYIDKVRALRQELAVLIAAPQPDRAAIDAKLAEIRTGVSEMQARIQGISTDALLALPQDMRSKLTEPRKPEP
jgi:uncharacterized membrane protein